MTKGPLTSLFTGTFPLARSRKRLDAIGRAFAEAFEADHSRFVLWIPVGIGCGIGGYFALPVEPPVIVLPIILLVCLGAFICARGWLRYCILCLFILFLGVGLAQWRSLRVAAPVLTESIKGTFITAKIVNMDPQDGSGVRILLSEMDIPELKVEETPRHARITVRTSYGDVKAGDIIKLRVILEPPSGPIAPYAFDYARASWFEGVGAIGYAIGPVELVEPAKDMHFAVWIERMRAFVTARVLERAGPEGGGPIAAALLTGVRGPISDEDKEAMRVAGLAHLLSISGLHIGLVTATTFFVFRALCALIQPIALKYDTKKIATIGAWLVALFYFGLSGATIPTQRAFFTTSIVLLALLLGRQPLSLRLVIFSALVIIVLTPEALLSASFHMSFAAVIMLVVTYRWLAPHLAAWRRYRSSIQRSAFYFLGVILTTVISDVAIAPFAAFHFNQFTSYGLLANLVAVPAMAVWIMPAGLLALILMPFGLDGFAIDMMSYGVVLMLKTAHLVASLPGASFVVPSYPTYALSLLTLATLWVLLWRRMIVQVLAVPFFAVFVLILAQNRPPDLLVSRKADLLAMPTDAGLAVSSMVKARYSREQWASFAGKNTFYRWDSVQEKAGSRERRQGPPLARCDDFGCTVLKGSHRIGFAHSAEALVEDCRRATLVISSVPIRQSCSSPVIRIDRFDTSRNGVYALWFDDDGDGIRVETVRSSRGVRPWVRPPRIYSQMDEDDASTDLVEDGGLIQVEETAQ